MHYTEKYLLDPTHRVSIILVGCGGTGTQVLAGLARLNHALVKLGHPGLHVTLFDDDIISDSNVGRQQFSESDIGQFKAAVAMSRVNRFYGLDWKSNCSKFLNQETANILITCVDAAKTRIDIAKSLKTKRLGEPYNHTFYWLDFGNLRATGQVVLGTVGSINQSFGGMRSLKNVVKLLPGIKKIKEEDQGPSCSLAEALGKQDLFINSTLANFGLNLLWRMFREGRISYQGCYLNLNTMSANPIKIEK